MSLRREAKSLYYRMMEDEKGECLKTLAAITIIALAIVTVICVINGAVY